VLSAILYLGNVTYKKRATGRDEGLEVGPPEVLDTLSQLLKVTCRHHHPSSHPLLALIGHKGQPGLTQAASSSKCQNFLHLWRFSEPGLSGCFLSCHLCNSPSSFLKNSEVSSCFGPLSERPKPHPQQLGPAQQCTLVVPVLRRLRQEVI
jgi:hypothetical protein